MLLVIRNIGSSDALMPLGNQLFSEPMFTVVCVIMLPQRSPDHNDFNDKWLLYK